MGVRELGSCCACTVGFFKLRNLSSWLIAHSTITYDDIGPPGEDDRWNTRLLLHEVLEKRFPLMYVRRRLQSTGRIDGECHIAQTSEAGEDRREYI